MALKLAIGSALSAAALWASTASACTSPPAPPPPPPQLVGESAAAYEQRIARLRAEAGVALQARLEEWVLTRENGPWDFANVTRIAVVEVVQISLPDGPPSMTSNVVFNVTAPERGMVRGEQFTLSEPRFASMPCVPVAQYSAGERYVAFAGEGPIARQSPIFVLLPVAEVRSERGLALLRAAEAAAR